jgi:hypothetical protein
VFFKEVDRTARKNDIRDALLDIARSNGEFLSDARANNLAIKFKRGLFDPDLARFIQYSDPVGEEAATNVDKERSAVAA